MVDLHSLVVIEVGFSMCRMALTFLLMINISYIISFHEAKFLPLNFWISTLVQNVEAMFLLKMRVLLTFLCCY